MIKINGMVFGVWLGFYDLEKVWGVDNYVDGIVIVERM